MVWYAQPMANTEIYISKGGQPPESPCSFEEAQQMLSSGNLSAEDLAWCEGLAEWYGEFSYAAYKGVKKSRRTSFRSLRTKYPS